MRLAEVKMRVLCLIFSVLLPDVPHSATKLSI